MVLRETFISFGGLYERFSIVLKPLLLNRSSHEVEIGLLEVRCGLPLKELIYVNTFDTK